jgi:Ni,Fe-hydrogenase maturation factor
MFNFVQTVINAMQHAAKAEGKTGVEKKEIAMDFATQELSKASGIKEELSEDIVEAVDKAIELIIAFTKNSKKKTKK